MTITNPWVNYSNTTNPNTGSSLNVGSTNANTPVGTITTGSLLLATLIVGIISDPGAITIAGFTPLVSQWDSTAFYRVTIGYKIASASESGSYAASWGSSAINATWMLANFVGTSTTNPIDAFSQSFNDAGSTNMLAVSCSPSNSNDFLVGVWGAYSGQGPYAVPGTMSLIADINPTGSENVAEILMGGQQLSASGATGSRTATQTLSNVSGGFLFALAPSGGAIPYYSFHSSIF